VNVHFCLDEQGRPRAEVTPRLQVVRWYLEGDVQSNAAWCDHLRHVISWLQADSSMLAWEGTGNAFTVMLSGSGARLLPAWSEDEPGCDLPLEEFDTVIGGWARFLRDHGLAPVGPAAGAAA
jgi:hypothetical protein